MNILIVEDELILAHTLESFLHEMGYNQVSIEPDFLDAKNILTNHTFGFVILDINLGQGGEGFELAAICKQKEIPFLYTTSYTDKDTMNKAIESNPSAYLVKPISEVTFYAAVQIVLNLLKQDSKAVLEFKDGTTLIRVPLKQILYFKSENIYVNIVTETKTHLYRGSLAALMDKLPTGSLVQTHRSFAVNPTQVTSVSSNYLTIGELEIPISRNFKNQMFKQG